MYVKQGLVVQPIIVCPTSGLMYGAVVAIATAVELWARESAPDLLDSAINLALKCWRRYSRPASL